MAEEAVIRIVIEGGGSGVGESAPSDAAAGQQRTQTTYTRRETKSPPSAGSSESSSETHSPTSGPSTSSSGETGLAKTTSELIRLSALSTLSDLTSAVSDVQENITAATARLNAPGVIDAEWEQIHPTKNLPFDGSMDQYKLLEDKSENATPDFDIGATDQMDNLIEKLREWTDAYRELAEVNRDLIAVADEMPSAISAKDQTEKLSDIIDAEWEVIEPTKHIEDQRRGLTPTEPEPPKPPPEYGGMIPDEGPGRGMIPRPGEEMIPDGGRGMIPHPGEGMEERPEFSWKRGGKFNWKTGNYRWTGWHGGDAKGGFDWQPNPPPFRWKGWQSPAQGGVGSEPGGPQWHPGKDAFGPFGGGGMMKTLGDMWGAIKPHMPMIAAALLADRMVKGAVKGGFSMLSTAATTVASANADPGAHIQKFGDALSKVGDSIPIFGTELLIAGEAAKAFGSIMQALNETADRYGEFSPQIAQAQAIAEIRHTLGDLRRSREVSAEMAKYLIAQSDLQQKFEDIKVKILVKMLPIMTNILEKIEAIVPSGNNIAFQIGMLVDPIETLTKLVGDFLHMKKEENLPKIEDPTSQLFDPKFMNAGGVPGEWTPNS